MITENGFRLATADVTPNAGAAPGGIGATSATKVIDTSGVNSFLRTFNDFGQNMKLAFSVNTAFACGTFGATLEFQLVSLPILASKLTNATTTGKRTHIAAVVTDIADADPLLADTFIVTGHGLPVGTPVYLSALATTTGVSTNTIYYVIPTTADRFQLALSMANAIAGTKIDLLTGDGTATIEFIPTIHASSGGLQMYDVGVPTNQGPLRGAGYYFQVPVRPITAFTPQHALATGQTLKQPLLGGPATGLIAANAQRYFYLRYVPSATITAGAITCDLVMDASGAAMSYPPTGMEVIG